MTEKEIKDTYIIGIPSDMTTGYLDKEKLSRKRTNVNDSHMHVEDRENHRKQNKSNAFVNHI